MTFNNIQLIKYGNNLIITFDGIEDQVTIPNWFLNRYYQIDNFEFGNGDVYSAADLFLALPVFSYGNESNNNISGYAGIDHIYGYAGNDSLSGLADNDILYGGLGDDTLSGGTENDQLLGGEGADTLNGDNGNDELTGGPGNDTLNGGVGNDRIFFNVGDGQDVINHYDSSSSSLFYIDSLVFGSGINLEGVSVHKSSNHLIIKLVGTDDSVMFSNWFVNRYYQIDHFEFSDGTKLTPVELIAAYPLLVDGTASNDNLTGYTGIDNINGLAGNDTLSGGAGDDRLFGGTGTDTLNGGNDHDHLDGGDDNDRLNGDAGNDVLIGGSGIDTLAGGTGDDEITGGTGNDTLDGGAGSDRIFFNVGDGQDTLNHYDTVAAYIDTVVFGVGISQDQFDLIKNGYHLVLKLNDSDQITFMNWFHGASYQIDNFEFSDGTNLTPVELIAAYPLLVDGTASNDNLTGYTGIDNINGLAGNDTLSGGAGDDRLFGGTGTDTLNGGNDHDHLDGGDDNDRLNGDAGNDVLIGGSGIDTLAGGTGDDEITGGTGNDTLDGGAGSDRIFFNVGDGQDTLNHYDTVAAYIDTVVFGVGISQDQFDLIKNGYHLVLKLNDSDQITFMNWFHGASYQIDNFEFSDGGTHNATELVSSLPITE